MLQTPPVLLECDLLPLYDTAIGTLLESKAYIRMPVFKMYYMHFQIEGLRKLWG